MFDDYLWKIYVYWTTFSDVKYQDLCATINPSKINKSSKDTDHSLITLEIKHEKNQAGISWRRDWRLYDR